MQPRVKIKAPDRGSLNKMDKKVQNWDEFSASLVELVKSWRATSNGELEIRFLLSKDSRSFYEASMEHICSHENNAITEDCWAEFQDFHFTHNDKEYRTRCIYDSLNLCVNPQTIIKERISRVTYEPYAGFRVRADLSLETCVPVNAVPRSVRPHTVRIRQRKT